MKKYYKLSTVLLLIISLTAFQGCVKEKIDLNKSGNNSISPQLAGALIYSSLSLKDIMNKTNKNGQLVADSTGFLTLVYKGNLFSLPAASVVTIPTQPSTNDSYNLSATDVVVLNATPVGSSYTVSDSSLVNFQAGGQTQVDVLNCKTATLALTLNYNIEHNAVIKITIPGATLSGVAFTQTIAVTYTGSPVTINESYPLDGYTINMTDGGTTHSTIKIRYDITLAGSANPNNVGDGISFTETFSNVSYNSIIGYLGQQSLSPNTDTIPITIFQNNILNAGATIHIVNPLIKVFLTNSYGLPINANFTTFEGYTPGQTVVPITGAPNPLNIPVPATIGQSATDSFKLDNSNSNLVSLINNFPKNVIYHVNSQSNPGGTVYTNFITDTSQFRVDLELDLPLYGTVTNFMFQDTVPYSFDLPSANIESITVRGYFSNGFPIDVKMRLAFVDSAYNVIDELINPTFPVIMPSAGIDANGKVIPSQIKNSTHDFVIPSSVIPQLSKVKYIFIAAEVSSANNGTTDVRIYDYYTIDVKIGVNVKALIKF